MSEYDDRQPAQPSPGQVEPSRVREAREEAMHQMWEGMKARLRKLFGRDEDSEHRYPPH